MNKFGLRLPSFVIAVVTLISALALPANAASPSAPPGAPTITIQNGDESISVTVEADPNGEAPVTHTVSASDVDNTPSSLITKTCNADPTSLDCTIIFDSNDGMTLGTRYIFTATSSNDDGDPGTTADGDSSVSAPSKVQRFAAACSEPDLNNAGWTQVTGYVQVLAEEVCELWITDTGTQTVTIPALPGVEDANDILEVLLVGAGGGGSAFSGGSAGGGGGGAMVFSPMGFSAANGNTYTLEIGAGGAGGTTAPGDQAGKKGGDSKFQDPNQSFVDFAAVGGDGGIGQSSAIAGKSGYPATASGSGITSTQKNAAVCVREDGSGTTFALTTGPLATAIGGEGCAELRTTGNEGQGAEGITTFTDITQHQWQSSSQALQTFTQNDANSQKVPVSDLPFAFSAGGGAGDHADSNGNLLNGGAGFSGGSGSGGDGGASSVADGVDGKDALISSGSGGGGGGQELGQFPVDGNGGAGADGFAIFRIMFSPAQVYTPPPPKNVPPSGATLQLDCSLTSNDDTYVFTGESVLVDFSDPSCQGWVWSQSSTSGIGNPSDPTTEWDFERSQTAPTLSLWLLNVADTNSATSPFSKTFVFEDMAAPTNPPQSTFTLWWTPVLDPPTGITGTPADQKANLSWTAPALDGAGVQDYEVVASPTNTSLNQVTQVCANTTCEITGLALDEEYLFEVLTVDMANRKSAASSSVSLFAIAPPGAPSISVAAGDQSATITVAAGSGGTPDSYTVSVVGDSSKTCTITAPATDCTITGLTNNTDYQFEATATNNSGTSAASNAVTGKPLPTVPGTPSITNVTVGNQSATITVAAGSGGTPDSYTVSVVGDSSKTCTITAPATDCTITGLTNGTSYQFEATATNTGGTSANPSQPSSPATPVAAAPSAPSAPTLSNVSIGDGDLTVDITAGSGTTPTSYTITATPNGGGTAVSSTCPYVQTVTSCTVTGLTNGTSYTLSATATGGNQTSSPTAPSSPATPVAAAPGTPSITNVTVGNQSATITVAAGSGGTPDSYTVSVVGDSSKTCTVTAPATDCTITGLTNGTSYQFEATATNTGGTSANPSQPSSPATPVAAAPVSNGNQNTAPAPPVISGGVTIPAPAVNTGLLPSPSQPAVATVSGQTQQVTVTPTQPIGCQSGASCQSPVGAIGNGTSVSIGNTQVTVSGPQLAGSTPSTTTVVMPGQGLNIAADGFTPGSEAKVFSLPLGAEIASLAVGADGLLAANPVLPQSLGSDVSAIQITGVTPEGPIELSITVLVTNAPQPKRDQQQLLPEVSSGESIVLIDGAQSQFTPEPTGTAVSLSAAGTALSVAVLTGSEVAPISVSGNLSAKQQSWVQFNGSGYVEYVDVFLFSTPIFLGRVLIDSDVNFVGSLQLPEGFEPGMHTLQTVGKNAEGTEIAASLAIEVLREEAPRVWTKRVGNQVKIYALGAIGGGKIQFFENGREIAWVRAVDSSDPRLRIIRSGSLAGRDYFVRTRDGELGKNAFEIYLDGERVLRRIFTRTE